MIRTRPPSVERRIAVLLTLLALHFVPISSLAADWPQWRGPSGQGHSSEKDLPTSWNIKTGENILWKAPLPRSDNPYSSPIVKSNRVFVTLAMNKTREHQVLCFDAASGKQLWSTPVEPGPWNLTDVRGGYAAPTPAADDQRVYVLFGSAVLAALDFDGKVAWRKDLPRYAFDVAIGCSPVLYKDTLILQADMVQKQSALFAFDCATGEIRWEIKRPNANFTHTTPLIVQVNDKPIMLMAGADALQVASPDTGQLLSWTRARGDTVSPVFANGIAYIDSGRGGAGFAIAIDPAAQGECKDNLKWTVRQVPEGFSSPIVVGEHLYRLHAPGILKCWKLATGEEVFSQRLDGAAPAISPVATADGLIFFASPNRSHVIKAGPTFEVIATNELGDSNYASPAISGGRLFIKGRNFLYCIGR